MKRALLVLVSTVALLLSNISAQASEDETKYLWPPSYNSGDTTNQTLKGFTFTTVDENDQFGEGHSFIRTFGTVQPYCESFSDPFCLEEIGKGNQWWAGLVFPPCTSQYELAPCIAGVSVKDPDGKVEKLTLQRISSGITWPADLKIGLPKGSMPSLWEKTREKNSGYGYQVSVFGGLSVGTSKSGSLSTIQRVQVRDFNASIRRYSTKTGKFEPPTFKKLANGRGSYGLISPRQCIWITETECGLLQEFNDTEIIELSIHVPKGLGNWLMGRLNEPRVSIVALPGRSNGIQYEKISISAKPVLVPLLTAKVELSSASQDLINDYENNEMCKSMGVCRGGYYGGITASNGEYVFDKFKKFEDYLEDKAAIMFPRWSVRSLLSTEPSLSQCFGKNQESFSGIVTTNASIYIGAPPIFNQGEFLYKVAGVHRMPSGEVFRGSYNLALTSKFARCMYGFTEAPIRASIQVTSAEGEPQIATSSFAESQGWVYLSASGFTFSQPEIKARLIQEIASNPIVKAPVKRVLITCVKGKISRKISGVAPKCPVGFKKK